MGESMLTLGWNIIHEDPYNITAYTEFMACFEFASILAVRLSPANM